MPDVGQAAQIPYAAWFTGGIAIAFLGNALMKAIDRIGGKSGSSGGGKTVQIPQSVVDQLTDSAAALSKAATVMEQQGGIIRQNTEALTRMSMFMEQQTKMMDKLADGYAKLPMEIARAVDRAD